MLRSGTTKGQQGVLLGRVALRHADLADGVGHVFNRQLQQQVQQLRFCPRSAGFLHDPGQQLFKPCLSRVPIQRNGGPRWIKPAQQEVHIRDGQRSLFAIAGWARVGASALRTHGQA